MNRAAAFLGDGLMVVWPIPADDINRDALIAAALPDLDAIAADAGCYLLGASTWRVLHDVDQLPGWDRYEGALLIATTPITTLRRYRVTDDRPPCTLGPPTAQSTCYCTGRPGCQMLDDDEDELPDLDDIKPLDDECPQCGFPGLCECP